MVKDILIQIQNITNNKHQQFLILLEKMQFIYKLMYYLIMKYLLIIEINKRMEILLYVILNLLSLILK